MMASCGFFFQIRTKPVELFFPEDPVGRQSSRHGILQRILNLFAKGNGP
jgi:hypothetical protein